MSVYNLSAANTIQLAGGPSMIKLHEFMHGFFFTTEKYSLITYTCETEKDNTIKLTYLREEILIEFEQKNQERYLPGMLENIKKIAEEK